MEEDSIKRREQIHQLPDGLAFESAKGARYTPPIVRSIEPDAPRTVPDSFPLFWIYDRFHYLRVR